jgi:hypothetical protein
MLMTPKQAHQWLSDNWRSVHQSFEDIAARRVRYAAPADGYMTNRGPNAPGVYFLFDEDCLQYAGKAARIAARTWTHFTARRIPWRYLSWIECPHEVSEEVEHFYIDLFDPPYNVKFDERFGLHMASLVDGSA